MLNPMYEQVLVLPIDPHKEKGTILDIPDEAKERPTKGEVLAVGQGRLDKDGNLKPLLIKKGDIVVFKKWSATEYEEDDTTLYFVSEGDILATETADAAPEA